MGGCCCCASRRAESDRTPVYFYCPQELDENEPFSTSHLASTAVPVGLLVDTNLDTSSPDTYRAPPAPVPYDVGVACSQTVPGNTENCGNKTDNVQSTDSLPAGGPDEDLKGLKCKSKSDSVHDSPKVKEDEICKLKDTKSPVTDEEDVCPTCLEEYDLENPRIITKCEHHFHLACILEWMERSNTCPICDQQEGDEAERIVVVVEYVPNGTLREHLDGAHGSRSPLTWLLGWILLLLMWLMLLHTSTLHVYRKYWSLTTSPTP